MEDIKRIKIKKDIDLQPRTARPRARKPRVKRSGASGFGNGNLKKVFEVRSRTIWDKLSSTKWVVFGLTMGVVLATVGSIAALNGWFGGGGSIPSDTMTRGLVGYWSFDEGSGTITHDSSGNGNNGTTVNGVQWTSGKVNGAMLFGSDDYVAVADSASLDITSTITIEAWAKDPPLEPGELVSLRTENSKTYDLGDGKRRQISKIGAVHYDENGDWQDIDNAWVSATAPWDWYMKKDSYYTYVLENFTAGQILKFESQGSEVSFQPMELQWTNDLKQIQSISMPQNVPVSVTNEPVEILSGMEGGIGKIRWDDGYGVGRHFEWINTPERLEKVLQLDSQPPTPAQYIIDGGNPVIRLNFIFAPSSDLDIYVDGVLWDKSSKTQTVNQIEFKKDGELLWVANPARYWDSSDENEGIGTTELKRAGNSLYISVSVPYDWLQEATYPIRIDPTWQVGAGTDDVLVDNALGSWRLSPAASLVGAGYSESGYIKQGSGMRFTGITIPRGSTIDNAYLTLNARSSLSNTIVNSKIIGEAADSAATFSTIANYQSRRGTSVGGANNNNRTVAEVLWDSIASWTVDTEYNSPDIKTVVQEITDRTGWTSGNDMVIFWDDHDARGTQSDAVWRTAKSYNFSTTLAAKLVIEYTVPPKIIVSKGTDAYALEMSTDGSTLYGYINGVTTTASVATPLQWHHYVFTYNGSEQILYIDGSQAAASSTSGAITTNATNLKIGEYFSGPIDEVRIYNRALSATEVRYHYNRGGPVGHWKFDEGSGDTAYDDTDNDNDGTLYGEMATSTSGSSGWTAGKYGSALSFDGADDYVELGDRFTGIVTTAGTYSISSWIYARAVPGTVINISPGGNSSDRNGINLVGGNVQGGYWNGTTYVGKQGAITLNAWHHLALINSAGTITFYIDGISQTTTGMGGLNQENQIGHNTSYYFNGLIDDVRIYNYARTPEEIGLDYNAGFAAHFGPQTSCDQDPGACMTEGLAGYWDMEEGSGTVAYDKSSNSNDGTIVSAPPWSGGIIPLSGGKAGGTALNFDGSADYVDAGNGASLNVNGNFSISAWVYTAGTGTGLKSIVTKGTGATTNYGFALSDDDNSLGFFVYDTGSTARGILSPSNSILPLNAWSHVVGVYNGAEFSIYINGAKTSDTYSWANTGMVQTSANAQIGARGGAQLFNGFIDDVRIYNRALSAEEVRYHYNRGAPVGHWKFDEGSGATAYDSTENNNDGTLKGEMATSTTHGWTAGKYGSALSFDGVDDYINVGSGASLDITGPITFSAWIKRSNIGSQHSLGGKWEWSEGNYRSYYLQVFSDDLPDLFLSSNGTDAGSIRLRGVTPILANRWYHLTGVYDGSNMKLYINGVLDSSRSYSSGIYSRAATPVVLGIQNPSSPSTFFNGLIDDVRIYNYARTPEEIRLDYNAGLAAHFGPKSDCSFDPGACMTQGLVGYWDFDEGSGTESYDASGNGNKGIPGCASGHTDNGDGTCTATFYPDADPETSSVDGTVWMNGGNKTWAAIRDGAGSGANDSPATNLCAYLDAGTTDWDYLNRCILLFDTSSLGSAAIIESAVFSIYGYGKADGAGWAPNINVYSSNPASNTGLVAGDYDSIGTTAFSTAITYAGWNTAGYNDFTLNASGIAAVDKTGVTKLGMRNANYDVANSAPAWSSQKEAFLRVYLSEQGDGFKPKLVVTYTSAPVWETGIVPLSGGKSGGGALQFDGTDDYVDVNNSNIFDVAAGGARSQFAWIKPNTLSGYQGIIVQRNSGASSRFGLWTNGTDLYAEVSDDGRVFNVTGNAGTTLTVGQWYFVGLTMDNSGNIKIWKNSESFLIGKGTGGALTDFTEGPQIGRHSPSATQYFNGLIDEVRIYNRALSAEEVRYHYNRGGPVAHWKFDEGSGSTAYDSTENNNDGTIPGAVEMATSTTHGWVAGKYGSALSFDGADDYVDAGSSASLDLSSVVSIEAWIKTSDTNGMIVSKGDGAASGYHIYVVNGKLQYYIGLNGIVDTGSVVNDNAWHHIVLTADNTATSKVNAYVDGINVHTGSESLNAADAYNLLIGKHQDNTAYLSGLIDDVRVYNYARTPAQILQDYNQGLSTHFK